MNQMQQNRKPFPARLTEGNLALIPARGGSKAVPRKNIRRVANRPLMAWTIDAALAAGVFERIVVSTEDLEVADIARDCGAEVPFLRPADLATDQSSTVPVVQHAVEWLEQQSQRNLRWICLLQPTAPLRLPDDIRQAAAIADETQCDSVISVVRVEAHHPRLMKRIVDQRLIPFSEPEIEGTRRQDYRPHAYMRNGAIYWVRRDVIMEHGSLWGDHIRPLIMPPERSVNVDSKLDLILAESILGGRG